MRRRWCHLWRSFKFLCLGPFYSSVCCAKFTNWGVFVGGCCARGSGGGMVSRCRCWKLLTVCVQGHNFTKCLLCGGYGRVWQGFKFEEAAYAAVSRVCIV